MTSLEPFVGTLIGAGWEETQALGEDRAFVVRIRLDGPVSWPMQAVWQAWPVTVSRAEASSPTPDGVIKERGEDGRRPDGPGLSHSVSSPSVSPDAATSIPGADAVPDLEGMLHATWHDERRGEPQNDPDAGLTHEQIAAEIGDLARGGTAIGGTVLGALNRAYQRGLEHPDRIRNNWPCNGEPEASARSLQDTIDEDEARQVAASERVFAAVHAYLTEMEETEEDGDHTEIRQFEAMKAAIAVADRARDQRAEREDAQRPRPEAASPITEGEAPASIAQPPSSQESGVGETEGWVLVPREPTQEMWCSFRNADAGHVLFHQGYRAMIAAAPRPSQREG